MPSVEIPAWRENVRQHIQSAVEIFRAHPDADADEILQLITDSGLEQPLAIQLLLFVPLAYGRVMLSDKDILFPSTYLCLGKPAKRRLDALPLWAEALEYAKQDREPFFPIAGRSSEVRAVNDAMRDGEKLEDLIFTPPGFLWPIESVPGLAPGFKQPGVFRQIWDDPAEYHSMTRRGRTAARVAMVIAIMVGLFAVGAVAYYGLAVLQAK